MELAVPSGWNSWSALKGRRRHPVRLSASVDSIPYADNDFFSSVGSLSNYPDYDEEDGSVNNILDALGDRTSSAAGLSSAVSWSVLDGVGATATTTTHSHHHNNNNNNSNNINNNVNMRTGAPPPTTTTTSNLNSNSMMTTSMLVVSGLSGLTTTMMRPPSSHNNLTLTELSVMAKCDNESSGVGSSASGGSGSGAGTNSSASPTGSSVPQNEDYEHVYCQLDPYFSPPINITKSQPIVSQGNTRFSTRASLRSWGRTATTMDRDPGIIPFLQQALALRYREMLNTYLQQAPPWFQAHMGSTDLEEICPVVYQVLPEKTSSCIYGTTSSKKFLSERQHDSYKPILPHQIFAKTSEDDMSRVFWVQGEPGSGKTLLCCRILSEWVGYHSYNYTNSPLNTRIGEFQVLFYVPLREVRGSLSRFLMRELIPKRSILSRMKPANVWKCLNLLGNSMLLVLDGLDDVTDEDLLKEIQDVLNGQMFPQCLVLVTSTSRPPHGDKVSSWMNRGSVRKYLVSGMDWTQIQCCIRRYFTGRKFRNETRMAEILSDRHDLCSLASSPFMCLLLCSVFEEVGDVPGSNAELYLCLLRSLIYQNGLIKSDSNNSSPCKDNSIPLKYRKVLEDFGKLALHKLSERRVHYFEPEVMDYCQNMDIVKCGILSKWKGFFRKSAKKSSIYPLTLLHPSLNTFLAAYYLATTVNYPSMLRREMELLPGIECLQECQVRFGNTAFSVVQLVMELLHKNSYTVFGTMSLLDISLNHILALLGAAGFYESNLSAVCSIMRSLKHVSINVGSEWVSELKQVLSSDHCPFESLEIVIKPGYSLSRLIEGLCLNESISSVKFSSVPGQDWSGVEVNLICGQLLQLLSEKKLKCLEISMTCLEDKEHSRFQGVVDSLCFILSKQIPLQKLVLDMDLTSPQVTQLASFIKCHEFIDVLHLPHLGCGPEGLRAIADLLYNKPFLSLSLAGTWRSTSSEDDMDIVVEPVPLNSPFHIGTMSSLTKGGLFSSLPRGPLNGSIKSPSIRRKKMNHLTENDKRNSDSVLFQRNFLPLPICDQANHELDGFHSIFSVLRFNDSNCNLKSLNIGKCVLGWEDVICLGETIRKSTCLDSLRMEGMKLCDVLPVLLGLQENSSLKMLDLSSPHVVIGDDALQLACQSLGKNRTLRLLSLQGWTFYIEEERSLESLENLFRSSNLQDLDLTGVRVHISPTTKTATSPGVAGVGLNTSGSSTCSNSNNSDKNSATSSLDKKSVKEMKPSSKEKLINNSKAAGKKTSISSVMSLTGLTSNGLKRLCPDLSFLRIGGMQVEMGKSQVWRSMDILAQLVPLVERGKISHLDLSLDKNDSHFSLDDKLVVKTMKLIGQNFPKLQRLVLNHWRVKLSEKSCKEVGKYLQGLDFLSGISMDHCVVTCESGGLSSSSNSSGHGHHTYSSYSSSASSQPSKRIDSLLTSSILSSVKSLSDFSWAHFDPSQMPQLSRALCDHHSVVPTLGGLTVKLESVPLAAIKLLISNSHAKSNSSGVVIEYVGNHSVLVKKLKDRSDHLIHKLKRLL